MPILNVQLDSVGHSGVVPRIIYIATNDTLAEVTAAGYLNNLVTSNILISENDIVLITTKTSPSAIPISCSWLAVSKTGNDWSLVTVTSPSTVASVAGTANRITATGATNVVIDIDVAYVGQSSITTLGAITSGTWLGSSVDVAHGGTGSSSFSPYAVICAGTTATGVFQNVSGVGTAGQILVSNGAAAYPTWQTIAGGGDMLLAGVQTNTGAKSFNVNTFILKGSTSGTITLNATAVAGTNTITFPAATGIVALTSDVPTFPLSLANGGTAAALVASNGGIFYSNATTGAILAGTATANRMLQSGASSAPAWSTATYPSTAASSGKLLRADGTNWVASTASFSDTYVGNELLIATATNSVGGLANVANSILITTAGSVPTWSTTLPAAILSNITTVGTITSGTWNGSTIMVPYGGTGNTTFTAYSVILGGATATGAFQNVSGLGAAGTVLTSNGAGVAPTWQAGGSGTVTSVSGTASRITSTGGATPVIDIDAAYVGQASLTTLGTVTTGTWNASVLAMAYGGSAKALTADNGGIVYTDANSMEILAATATAGKVLQSGSNAAPTWSTPTYPSASGSAGKILRADGTNNLYSTATFADTYAASSLLYSNGANAVVGLTTVNNASLTTSATGVPTWAALTDGQIIIGSTAGAPIAASITAGSGITVTPGANSITIAAASTGGLTWNTIAGTTQAAAVSNAYVIGNASQTTITLPATAAVGDIVHVQGKGTAGWVLVANAGQTVHIGDQSTMVAGSLTSNKQYDALTVVCITANTEWANPNAPQTEGLTIV